MSRAFGDHGCIEYVDVRSGDALLTGRWKEFEDWLSLKRWFAKAKRALQVERDDVEFLMDLYDPKGDLVDTVGITASSYELLNQEKAPTVAESRVFDRQFWDHATALHKNKQTGEP